MPYKDIEKRREYSRNYRSSHIEKALKYEAEWRNKNREKVRIKNLEWKRANPEKVKNEYKKYYLKNKDVINIKAKKWASRNRELINMKAKIRENKNPEKTIRTRRNFHLKKKFGITVEQYDEMLIKQNGVCEICGGTNGKKNFSVDHNHKTGKVRGLLCDHCNTGIGRLMEDISILQNAILYLRKYND